MATPIYLFHPQNGTSFVYTDLLAAREDLVPVYSEQQLEDLKAEHEALIKKKNADEKVESHELLEEVNRKTAEQVVAEQERLRAVAEAEKRAMIEAAAAMEENQRLADEAEAAEMEALMLGENFTSPEDHQAALLQFANDKLGLNKPTNTGIDNLVASIQEAMAQPEE